MPSIEVPVGTSLRNCTQQSVVDEINRKAFSNRDIIVDANNISTRLEGEFNQTLEYYNGQYEPGKIPFTFYSEAFAQLLNRIKIPVDFYKRNPSYLQHTLFDYWKIQHGGKFTFRLTTGENVRAVLSERYSPMDDNVLFPVVFQAFTGNDLNVHTFAYDHHVTRMLVSFPSTVVVHEGTTMMGGAAITNSETGYAAAYIEPIVFAGNNTFYNRAHVSNYGALKPIIHKGNIDITRIFPLVGRARDVAQVGIVQLAESMHAFVNTDHALSLAKKSGLPERFSQILEEEWADVERISKFNLARRILQMAAELPLFKSMTIEQQAGEVVGLFHSSRSRMAQIAEDIQQLNT